jgi:hypothetical protein
MRSDNFLFYALFAVWVPRTFTDAGLNLSSGEVRLVGRRGVNVFKVFKVLNALNALKDLI